MVGRGIVRPGRAARSGRGAQWQGPCLQGRVPCLRGTAVNAAIRLRFPSSSGCNRPTTAQFSVQPPWETCTAGRARRDAPMCVTREETRCGRTLPCELARISLRDMARVVGPAGVCGVAVVVGCSRTWPDETGGLASRSSWSASPGDAGLRGRPPCLRTPEPTAGHRRPRRDRRGDLELGCRRPHPIDHPAARGPNADPRDPQSFAKALQLSGVADRLEPRPARVPAPVGQVVERACDWAGVPPELDPETGPGLGPYPLPGMPGGPDCREAGGSRGPERVPDRDADAPSRPESPTGSGPGWQN